MISHKLSALKSLIWRIMGVIVLASVTYFFTRKWITTTYITFIHHATFLLVFYLHERFYLRFNFKNRKLEKTLKAFTYEIILGMGLGGLIVLFFTGSWIKVSEITLTYTAIKLVMFYLYDGIYNDIINHYAKRNIQKNKKTQGKH
jgi:uncharacterized membrane protein